MWSFTRLELEPQHVLYRPPDHVQIPKPGELPRPPPGPDQLRVLVEDEEGGVGRGVVVVEQLEEEAEPAFRAG